jgi:hypothetical protein
MDQEKGTEIYDISDPNNISLILQAPHWGNTSKGLIAKDKIGFIADGWEYGLYLVNFSNLMEPFQISQIQPPKCFINDAYVYNNCVFIAAGESGLLIYDISDIYNPLYLSSFGYGLNSTDGVFIQNDIAYLADGNDGLEIVNVSIPTAPYLLGNYSIDTESYGITGENNLIYLADGNMGLKILDVQNPNNISKLGEFKEEFGIVWNILVKNKIAYLANGLSGLIVVNTTNLQNLTKLGSYYRGGNTVDLALNEEVLYIADNWHGMYGLNISNFSKIERIHQFDPNSQQSTKFKAPIWLLTGLSILVIFGSIYIFQSKKRTYDANQ